VRPLARGGGHPSGTAVAGSLVRSTREHRAGRPRSLAQGAAGSPLDLAPGGVYRAAAVTCGAGGLLHHRFTLTPADAGAVCFLWHCPAGHPGSALPTTLPCGARTFLTGLAPGATARPTHPCSGYAGCHRARVANRSGPGHRSGCRTGSGLRPSIRCPHPPPTHWTPVSTPPIIQGDMATTKPTRIGKGWLQPTCPGTWLVRSSRGSGTGSSGGGTLAGAKARPAARQANGRTGSR
jgi:hypothetical protein